MTFRHCYQVEFTSEYDDDMSEDLLDLLIRATAVVTDIMVINVGIDKLEAK